MLRSSANSWGEGLVLYGVMGERVGTFSPLGGLWPDGSLAMAQGETDVWFEGKLICQGTCGYMQSTAVYQDRVGTNRASGTLYAGTNGARFYPYGEEINSPQTGNDREKFATYVRDEYTGLDYADQRWYASSYGRFVTPDPYVAGGAKKGSTNNPGGPGSWNRYAYTRGDPVNRFDPRGMDDCAAIFADAELGYDPYSSCSGAPQGNCPNIGMAFAGDPDDPTFEAQAAAMGCYGASVIPVAAPAPPSLTSSVSLYERPVYVDRTIPGIGSVPIYVGEHTYIDATAQLSTGAYVNFLCQGGPSGPNGTGNLVGSWQSGYNTMVSAPPSGPGLSANIQVGGAYSCSNCGVVTQLLASAALYMQSGNLAAYSGTMNGGYNSNSYAFTLLEDIGLAGYTSSGSAWSSFGTP
ncbi:MAG TPA: RHS repeat-associated core domain-containing protein [Bryobacteraceae bacterium]|nr:RHS repeat-associated core domain-containing protein [Bryobacteraceae bacterium]